MERKIKDKRKVFPIRIWKCLKCKKEFTNRNCIYRSEGSFIGFHCKSSTCPYCKIKTKVEYLGESK